MFKKKVSKVFLKVSLVILVLFLTSCAGISQFSQERNVRGCYIVDGKLNVTPPAGFSSMLDGRGVMLTGEMTVDDCVRIMEGFRGVL